MNIKNLTLNEVLEANRIVHAEMANMGEYNKSPHFLPENQERVRKVLIDLKSRLPKPRQSRLLDIGCGTGFILHLASDIFDKLDGIDITDDMMNKVDLSLGNITLTNAMAEDLPFENDHFDMVTAYSFLDHVIEYEKVLQEAYRVLKPAGIFYADLNPNKAFNDMLYNLSTNEKEEDLNEIIKREIKGGLHDGKYYNETFGLDEVMLTKAETVKSYERGFAANAVKEVAKKIGFSNVLISYQWYLGQAHITRSKKENVEIVEQYLRMFLPASASFFKYLRFIFIK